MKRCCSCSDSDRVTWFVVVWFPGSRVTVYGQSSGGTAIFSLLSSPLSKGLFHAAISLSGSPQMVANLTYATEQVRAALLVSRACSAAWVHAITSIPTMILHD